MRAPVHTIIKCFLAAKSGPENLCLHSGLGKYQTENINIKWCKQHVLCRYLCEKKLQGMKNYSNRHCYIEVTLFV